MLFSNSKHEARILKRSRNPESEHLPTVPHRAPVCLVLFFVEAVSDCRFSPYCVGGQRSPLQKRENERSKPSPTETINLHRKNGA